MKHIKLFEDFINENYESESLKESLDFTINYYTGDDDKAYVEEVLRASGVDATVEYGSLEDDIIIKTKNAAELRKAKKAIKADGFEINESIRAIKAKKPNDIIEIDIDSLTNENQNMYVVWIQDHYTKGKKIKMYVVPKSKAQTTASNLYNRYRDDMDTEVGIMTLDQWNKLPDKEKDLSRN